MLRAARGRVVFMSSIGARRGLPYLSAYNASKAAIGIVGDSLRQEMRPFGVEVSIIEPGAIATPMWGKGQAEAPDIIAAMDAGPAGALRRAAGPYRRGSRRRPSPAAGRPTRSPRPSSTPSPTRSPRPAMWSGSTPRLRRSPARCSPIAPWIGSSSASSTARSSDGRPGHRRLERHRRGDGPAAGPRARRETGPGRAPRGTPTTAGERARRRDGDRRRPHGGRRAGADRRRASRPSTDASTCWSTTPARRGGASLATAAGSTCADTWSSTSTPSCGSPRRCCRCCAARPRARS